MKKSIILFFSICLILSGCLSTRATTSISAAGLYFDLEGTQPTEKYQARDVFYFIVTLEEPLPDSILRVSWVAVDTNRLAPNSVLKIDEIKPTSSPVIFELENAGNFWPTGQYKVFLYLDGKESREIDFEVYHDYFSE